MPWPGLCLECKVSIFTHAKDKNNLAVFNALLRQREKRSFQGVFVKLQSLLNAIDRIVFNGLRYTGPDILLLSFFWVTTFVWSVSPRASWALPFSPRSSFYDLSFWLFMHDPFFNFISVLFVLSFSFIVLDWRSCSSQGFLTKGEVVCASEIIVSVEWTDKGYLIN